MKYPSLTGIFKSFLEFYHHQVDLKQSPAQITDDLDNMLNGKKRKTSHESTQDLLQQLANEPIDAPDEITTDALMTIRWGSLIHGVKFLRMAAVTDFQLTYEYVSDGFKMLSQLTDSTKISPVSYELLLSAGSGSKRSSRYHNGFGAGSFLLEDTHQRSYWLSVLHRIVAFNMGLVLFNLQNVAFENAEKRVANPGPDEVIQISSTKIKAKNIPIKDCAFPIVHKKEWTRLRQALAESSYKEYLRSGGQADYSEYTKRIFQVSVKRVLVTLTICQCFGPVALFWEALSPSCLYKIRHVELRRTSVDTKSWSNVNKQLWGITYLNPFQDPQKIEKTVEKMFASEGKDFNMEGNYDYLEDDDTYKEMRNEVLEEWEARNPSSQ